MLRTETVDDSTLTLIKKLHSKDYLKDFVLVGGTVLALQYGHRNSIDIEFFSMVEFDENTIREKLEIDFGFQTDYIENNTIKGSIDNIKVDLLTHSYNHIFPPIVLENVIMASAKDICAMKLNAIAGNGTRVKDFIDIYILLNDFSISDMLTFYESKYDKRSSFHVLKSLTYFDEVDLNDWPDMITQKNLSWEKIKNVINKKCKDYTSAIINKEN